jgi:DNA-binding HxlR family transcriptional regulator
VPKLSDKVLTERLRDLIGAGLIARRKATGRQRHEVYELTARARSLAKLLGELYGWGMAHAQVFGVKVGQPLMRLNDARKSGGDGV